MPRVGPTKTFIFLFLLIHRPLSPLSPGLSLSTLSISPLLSRLSPAPGAAAPLPSAAGGRRGDASPRWPAFGAWARRRLPSAANGRHGVPSAAGGSSSAARIEPVAAERARRRISAAIPTERSSEEAPVTEMVARGSPAGEVEGTAMPAAKHVPALSPHLARSERGQLLRTAYCRFFPKVLTRTRLLQRAQGARLGHDFVQLESNLGRGWLGLLAISLHNVCSN
uniref:Uncharacterized protein n=1 Tax=Oryza brachyantha TaxID=4533 RepID=J3LRR7_ORYBR